MRERLRLTLLTSATGGLVYELIVLYLEFRYIPQICFLYLHISHQKRTPHLMQRTLNEECIAARTHFNQK